MFATTIGHGWRVVFNHAGWGLAEARKLSLAGVDACWLPAERKAALRAEFSAALDALEAQVDRSDRSVDLAIERR